MREDEKFKIEIPLNSVFKFGNKSCADKLAIKCIEDVLGSVCKDCVFKDDPYCEVFNCIRDFRTDGKDVYFIEAGEGLS